MLNIVAIVTPCYKNGNIDWANFKFLINFLLFNKISKILIFGTTGESFNYSLNDYINFFFFFNKIKNFLIFCVYNKNIKKILKLLFILKKKNFSILLTVPSFILPNNFSIYKYFKIIKKIGIKVFFYYIPKRNNFNLSLIFLKKIKKMKFFFSIKNSLNDFKRNFIFKKNKLILFSGDDKLIFNCKIINYKGTISVLNNNFPKMFNNIKKKKIIFKNYSFNINPIFIKKNMILNRILNNFFNVLLFDLNYFFFTQSQT